MGFPNIERDSRVRSEDFLSFVRTYGAEHITPEREHLRIFLDNQPFDLKLTNVGGEDTPAFIAWLDTHPQDENHPNALPGLPHASAQERARLITKLNSFYDLGLTTIVTPASTKSIPSIRDMVLIASEMTKIPFIFIILPGGKNREEVAEHSVIPPVAYRNVTSPTNDKFLGIDKEGLSLLREFNPRGKGILFVDDVYTTGGTDEGMQEVIRNVLHLSPDVQQPLVVVATESVYGAGYPAKSPDHVFSCIHLPEFIGDLQAI